MYYVTCPQCGAQYTPLMSEIYVTCVECGKKLPSPQKLKLVLPKLEGPPNRKYKKED